MSDEEGIFYLVVVGLSFLIGGVIYLGVNHMEVFWSIILGLAFLAAVIAGLICGVAWFFNKYIR